MLEQGTVPLPARPGPVFGLAGISNSPVKETGAAPPGGGTPWVTNRGKLWPRKLSCPRQHVAAVGPWLTLRFEPPQRYLKPPSQRWMPRGVLRGTPARSRLGRCWRRGAFNVCRRMSWFSSEMFPSVGYPSEWIALYPVFYSSRFAPAPCVPGARGPERGGEQGQDGRGGEDLSLRLAQAQFPNTGSRAPADSSMDSWGGGRPSHAALPGGTSRDSDAPQQALWHQPEPFAQKPAMLRRVIGIPKAGCLVDPGFLRSERVTVGGEQRTARSAAPRAGGRVPSTGKRGISEARSQDSELSRRMREEKVFGTRRQTPKTGDNVIIFSSCHITEWLVFPRSLFIISSNLPA